MAETEVGCPARVGLIPHHPTSKERQVSTRQRKKQQNRRHEHSAKSRKRIAMVGGLTAGATTTVSERAPRQTTMDTEAQLAESDEVLAAVAKVPGFRTGRERLK